MKTTFDKAFDYLLDDESRKYTNIEHDAGGPTKFGITKKTLAEYLKQTVTDQQVENLSEPVAKQIYFDLWWRTIGLDRISEPVIAIALFDTAVLYGSGTTIVMAQRALCGAGRFLTVDGVLGPNTLHYLNGISNYLFMTVFRGQILQRIEAVITAKPENAKFREGWINRANRLLTLVNKPETGART